MAPAGSLKGLAKRQAVTDLLKKLGDDPNSTDLPSAQRDAALEELKIYGREPSYAEPIFTSEGIKLLARHAFDSTSDATSRNALRVLCNALVLVQATRQMFVALGYEEKACRKLQNNNADDEFLVSRLLFLTTYNTKIDLDALIDRYNLADSIVLNLERHTQRATAKDSKANLNPMEDMALAETAKLLFNITHHRPQKAVSFVPAIPKLVTLLCYRDLPSGLPLDPPLGQVVNALLNLDLGAEEARASLCPQDEPTLLAARLILLLDLALKAYPDSELEPTVTPLVAITKNLHEHASEDVRKYMRGKLLPTEEDRAQVLGQGKTLSAMLLRNSTNPVTPELRKAILHLLFEMSDKDASKFVDNVGYGFASGFLFENEIPIPANASSETATERQQTGRPVNPITGQYLDAERFQDVPEMTEEEKEREAERLFVLFERLKQNGLINVQNPVEQAIREGRFHDVDDSDRVEELE